MHAYAPGIWLFIPRNITVSDFHVDMTERIFELTNSTFLKTLFFKAVLGL